MKFRSLSFLIIILTVSINTNAQWVLQNPKLQAERLTDIVTADSVTSYCAGYFGQIMKSTDKGDSWKILNTGINELFIRIFFINAKNGWALTYNSNKLYRTTDGGLSWLLVSKIDSTKMISNLVFINDSTGFITGNFNSFIRTDDGGQTWTTINVTNTTWSGTSSIFFLNEKFGLLCINSLSIYKTQDGGVTWRQISAEHSFGNITKIYCTDSLRIFAASKIDSPEHPIGLLNITVDGGKYWDRTFFDGPIQNIYFSNSIVGAMIKGDKILVTSSGGYNWKETGVSASAISLFNDNKTALTIGGSNLIKKTTDFWNSYTNVTPSITSNCLTSVSPLDSMNVVACGAKETIVITHNGGKSWQKVHEFGASGLNDILYINKKEILACGEGIILSSLDGGITWGRDSLNATWLNDIEFVNDSLIFAAGGNKGKAALFFTQDKSLKWNALVGLPFDLPIDKMKFSNNHLGWISAGNEIYKTIDGGLTWNKIPGVKIFYGAVDARGDSAWFCNLNNVLLTTDAGNNWTQYKMFDYKETMFSTYCISMINSKEGSVGLFDGRILDTYDGGKSWNERVQLTSTPVFDLKYINRNHGWAVGDMGLILRYSNTSTNIKDENLQLIQHNFSLSQNYPNPFNPTTTISYQLSAFSRVKLKVYDMLGREVATLVNEEKAPGNYEVKFNVETRRGESLPSGVYIYRLQAGSYSETKKMTLLK